MGIVRIRIGNNSNSNDLAMIDGRSRWNGTMGIGEGSISGNQAANPLFIKILRISPLPAIFCADPSISMVGKYGRINNLAASTKKTTGIYLIPSRAFVRAVPPGTLRPRKTPGSAICGGPVRHQRHIFSRDFHTVNFARAPFPSLASEFLRGSRCLPNEGTTEATCKFAHLSRAMGQ
jgi:hypothetical protein